MVFQKFNYEGVFLMSKCIMITSLLVCMVAVAQSQPVSPSVVWDYKYDADILPGVAGAITDNGGSPVGEFISSGAVTTATSKVYLGTGPDTGTLFIDDLNGGGGNNILWAYPADTGGLAVTIHARMAMLESVQANNVFPFYYDDGVGLRRWFIQTDYVSGDNRVDLDMTVMREFWLAIPSGGATGSLWVENDSSGWSEEVFSYDSGNIAGLRRLLFADISSSTDSKQQWDYMHYKFGEAIPVPEPASLSLLAMGGLWLRRRLKK